MAIDRLLGYTGDLGIKAPVRAYAGTPITLSGEQTVDGIALVAGDRCLVGGQASGIANGVYVVSTGAWTRAPDCDGARDLVGGTLVFAPTGATLGGVMYALSGSGSKIPGVDAQFWSDISTTTLGVNVKHFGAVGDGVTDDGPAILLAVASNRSVYFPAGTYLIHSAIVFSALSNFALIGQGPGVSTIKCHATTVFTNSALAFASCSHFTVAGLTIDQNNNVSFSALRPLLLTLLCNDFSLSSNEFLRFTYIGVAVDSCARFWIDSNRIERDTAISTTNHSINVSSSLSVSSVGVITKNMCANSGSVFRGKNITVSHNRFNFNRYGGGIVTSGDGTAAYGHYVVTGNICSGGTGVDADGFNVVGMEIDGYYCTVNNNVVYQNGGAGIASMAFKSAITGNVCFGNGIGVGGAQYQAGIALGYVSAAHGAHYGLISNNICYDIGGGTQLYGLYEQSALLVGNNICSNKFEGNVTGSVFFQGTLGYYETQDWVAYTPVISATTGTITTPGTCSGRYKRIGKTVFIKVQCSITTNGTGAGKVQITLPTFSSVINGPFVCCGRENTLTGKMLVGQFINGTQNIQAAFYDDVYPGANGATMLLEGFYEVS